MNDKKMKLWLYSELPTLINEGVLTDENASKIKEHYGHVENHNSARILVTIFAILGSLLVASGIILIVARNWDNIGISLRTAIAFMPLLVGICIVLFTFFSKPSSSAWIEGSIGFLIIAFLGSVSLISQTYMTTNPVEDLILITCLLSLPFVYIFNATVPAFLFLSGISAWVTMSHGNSYRYYFWLLLALITPYIINIIRKTPLSNRLFFLLLGFFISILFGFGATIEHFFGGYQTWKVLLPLTFAVYLLIGIKLKYLGIGKKVNVPYFIGTYGTIILALVLSYKNWWSLDNNFYYLFYQTPSLNITNFIPDIIFGGILISLFSFLGYSVFKNRQFNNPILFLLPIFAIFAMQASGSDMAMTSIAIINLYVLTLGVYQIFIGSRKKDLMDANIGLITISLLTILRFTDSEIDLIIRGIAFVLIGLAFLVTNSLIVKSRKGVEQL